MGNLTWSNTSFVLLFFVFLICPLVWIIISTPIGHKFHRIPIIKFMSYLSSHIFFIAFLSVTIVFPTTKLFEYVIYNLNFIYLVLEPCRIDRFFHFFFEYQVSTLYTTLERMDPISLVSRSSSERPYEPIRSNWSWCYKNLYSIRRISSDHCARNRIRVLHFCCERK